MSETLYNLPSEYHIDSVELKSNVNDRFFELLYLYKQITINEGINFPFMYGTISIVDTNGIIENLPIIGEETITFKLKKKSGDKKYFEVKGSVYRISNRTKDPTKKVEYYDLDFITESALMNQVKRVSKTYNGTVSEAIEKISKEYFELERIKKIDEENPKPYTTIVIEDTMDKNKINIPNMSPLDSIDFLSDYFSYSKGSKSDKNPFNTTFNFFQTRQGFFFQSMEKLIQERSKDVKHEYNLINNLFIKDESVVVEQTDIYTASDYKLLNFYDNFSSSNNGYYGGTNFAYDSLTKTLHEYKLNYNQKFDDMSHLDKNNTNTDEFIFNKKPEKTLILSLCTNKGRADDKKNYIKDHTTDEIFYCREDEVDLLKNTKQERFNNGLVVEMTIPSNINLNVCDVIDLKFPSFQRDSNKKDYRDDKYFSGNYIVISIQHVISSIDQKSWNMVVTLMKDSYKSEIK